MRIDLAETPKRPWPIRVGLALTKLYVGVIPPPQLFVTYPSALMDRSLLRYMMRGTSARGPWTKGESELFAAFVSDLNACHF